MMSASSETEMTESAVTSSGTSEGPSDSKRPCLEDGSKNGAETTTKKVVDDWVFSNHALILSPDHSFKRDHTKLHVVVAVTGSVATIKLAELVSEIHRLSPENRLLIRVVTTENALHFFDPNQFSFPVYRDQHEWELWKKRGDPILHIELRRWADLMVIAPLDANTLAKIANGLCDNLLTNLVRAWDPTKPLYFCPAMNTYMLEHPLTFKHLEILKNLLNYKEIPTVEKEIMCGDKGYGAMAPVQMIASVVAGEVKKRFAIVSRN